MSAKALFKYLLLLLESYPILFVYMRVFQGVVYKNYPFTLKVISWKIQQQTTYFNIYSIAKMDDNASECGISISKLYIIDTMFYCNMDVLCNGGHKEA